MKSLKPLIVDSLFKLFISDYSSASPTIAPLEQALPFPSPAIIADFFHCNPSFPTREIVGLHRLNRLALLGKQYNLEAVLIVYDTTLPQDEAAREGGGNTYKLDGFPYSIKMLSSHTPYYGQRINIQGETNLLSTLSNTFLDIMSSYTHLPSNIAIARAKLFMYEHLTKCVFAPKVCYLSNLLPIFRSLLGSEFIFPMVANVVLSDPARHIGYILNPIDRPKRIDAISINNDALMLHDIVTSEYFVPSMDLYLFIQFVVNGNIHFGNSYGVVDRILSVLNLERKLYRRIGQDGENSIPFPSHQIRVRGRAKRRSYSLLSTYFEHYSAHAIYEYILSLT